jgi:hypothetical protein
MTVAGNVGALVKNRNAVALTSQFVGNDRARKTSPHYPNP